MFLISLGFFATNLFTHLPMQLQTVEYGGVPALCSAMQSSLCLLLVGRGLFVCFLTQMALCCDALYFLPGPRSVLKGELFFHPLLAPSKYQNCCHIKGNPVFQSWVPSLYASFLNLLVHQGLVLLSLFVLEQVLMQPRLASSPRNITEDGLECLCLLVPSLEYQNCRCTPFHQFMWCWGSNWGIGMLAKHSPK